MTDMELEPDRSCGTLALPESMSNILAARYFENRLVVWNEGFVHIYSVEECFLLSSVPQILKIADCQDVIQLDSADVLWILDKNGTLFLWNKLHSSFERAQGVYEPIPVRAGVLAMCSAEKGNMCLLSIVGDDLRLDLCSPTHSTENPVPRLHTITNVLITNKSCKDCVETCNIKYLSSELLVTSLTCRLCPSISLEECSIVVVSLGSGSVVCVPITGHPATQVPHQIFFSNYHTTAVVLGGARSSPKLCLFVSNNSMVTISLGKTKLEYQRQMCISTHTVCQASSSFVLVSDGNHSWQINLEQSENTVSPVFIRGIIAACQVVEGKLIVTTKHQTLYWINIPQETIQISEEPVCETLDSLCQELASVLKQLKQTESSIASENDALGELSLLKRIPCLKNAFVLQVKVYDALDSNYNFEIKLLNKSPVTLSSKCWSVLVRVKGKYINTSQNQFLSTNFQYNDIIRIVCLFKIKEIKFPLSLDCFLVNVLTAPNHDRKETCIGSEATWCSIPVGTVDLDISYFLTPISTALNVHEYIQGGLVTEARGHTHAIKIKLQDGVTMNCLANLLVKNCAHRGLRAVKSPTRLALRFETSRIDVKIENHNAVLESSSKVLLLQLQIYLMHQLLKKDDTSASVTVKLDPCSFLLAESIQLGLDYLETQRIEGRVSEEATQLYHMLRDDITKRLPLPL